MEVIKGPIVIIKGNKQNGLSVLQGTTAFSDVSVSTSQSLDKTFIWHLRLGHMSKKGLKALESYGLLGSNKLRPLKFCEACVLGKSSRICFKIVVHNTKKDPRLYPFLLAWTIMDNFFRWSKIFPLFYR